MTRVSVSAEDFNATIELFTRQLGFQLDRISPADSPTEADLSGFGVTLRLRAEGPGPVVADGLVIPAVEQSLVISHLRNSGEFGEGRAGMTYRDLIPNRQGGRFIASHIRIDGGGEVGDYEHFHNIRFQMIFCYRGWVKVVYEDQGDPFVLEAGDCVLQPPGIRHRVLESSPGLEVIEIGCPAEHDTYADHDIVLPTGLSEPDRDFGGQRFVRHVARSATWEPWRLAGFECRHFGIAGATDGLAGARVVRPTTSQATTGEVTHDGEFVFWFVLDGSLTLHVAGEDYQLAAGDSAVIPAGVAHTLSMPEVPGTVSEVPGTEFLEVTLPGVLGSA